MDERPRDALPAEPDEGLAGQRTRVPLPHFSRSLPMSLMRAREAVMRHFRPSLRAHGLTEQQWRVLRALSGAGEIEVTALAKATFLLGPSLSRILRDLEERGLIAKRSVEADQRRVVISMTAAGRELIDAVAPHSEEIYGRITALYGAKKLAELQDLLRELEAVMTATAPPDRDEEPAASTPRGRKRSAPKRSRQDGRSA